MTSIRKQLTLSLLVGFGLLLAGSGAAIYFFTRIALINEFDNGLRAKAVTMMSLTEQGDDGIQMDLPDTFRQRPGQAAPPQYFELWQTNGTVCGRSESLKDGDLAMRAGPGSSAMIWNLTLPDGKAGRAIGLRFTPQFEDEKARHLAPVEAIVVVAAERDALDQTLNVLALVLGLTGLLTLLVTVPLVSFSLERGHAPLEQLAQQAAAITADSLQTRLGTAAMPEELQPITTRLNDLLQRLAESFERERRFSADLAHELRTPLAELRSLAEVELAWPEGGAPEKHRETLNIALRMEALVTRLLELARAENGKIVMHREPVLLVPLIKEIWQPLAGTAEKKQLTFHFEMPPETMAPTDRALFRAILANLLANAVEYAPRNGLVEVAWHTAGTLTVSNTVHDLNAADVPHLFERLWRKDKARSGHEHFGLGLALSRTFAACLGFTLDAVLENKDRLTMKLAGLNNSTTQQKTDGTKG